MGISESGSLRGYSFKVWLYKTKESFKTLLTAGIAVGTYYLSKATLPEGIAPLLAAVAAAGSKWLLDLLDFWLSDVKL